MPTAGDLRRGPACATSGTGRTGGRIASANWARICASSRSVLANCPVAGKVPHLPGIDHDDRQSGGGECPRQRYFEAARRFEHNQGGLQGVQPIHRLSDPALVMRNLEARPRLDRHIDVCLRDIHADKDSLMLQPPCLRSLQNAGSRPFQLSGLVNGGTGRPELTDGLQYD